MKTIYKEDIRNNTQKGKTRKTAAHYIAKSCAICGNMLIDHDKLCRTCAAFINKKHAEDL